MTVEPYSPESVGPVVIEDQYGPEIYFYDRYRKKWLSTWLHAWYFGESGLSSSSGGMRMAGNMLTANSNLSFRLLPFPMTVVGYYTGGNLMLFSGTVGLRDGSSFIVSETFSAGSSALHKANMSVNVDLDPGTVGSSANPKYHAYVERTAGSHQLYFIALLRRRLAEWPKE